MSSEDNRSKKGGGIAILLVVMLGLGLYILYTDEIQATVEGAQTASDVSNVIKGFTDLIPLSLANVRADGDMVCDLDLSIPTTVNNRAFFGTSSGDVISQGEIKLPPNTISEFLNEPQWYYIGEQAGVANPFFEWKNCYIEGEGGIVSFIPIFNGQLAEEKLSLLSFGEPTREFVSLEPSAASLGPFTESTEVSLSISGKNNEGLFLVDKNDKGNFARVVSVSDGIAYPITSTLRFSIENVKLDDYEISVISVKPINEMVIGNPFTFNITS
jgi:hypothetical protein